jgi:heme/copper-type cytochrome/quinol oxidase subunit 2
LHLLLSEKCLLNEQSSLKEQVISQAAVILTISVIVIAVIIAFLIIFLVCTLRKNNYSSIKSLFLFTTFKYEPVRSDDDYLS